MLNAFLVALALSVGGQDPPKTDLPHFPEWAALPPTVPAPAPVKKLLDGQIYIVVSNTPCFILTSPPGLVDVKESGPVTIHGVFANGQGEVETRVYPQKQVFLITAKTSGQVEIICVMVGVKSVDSKYRAMVDVGKGPRPPPPDPTPPGPGPVPIVAPIAIAGYHVLMIEDKLQQDKLTVGQQRAMFGTLIRSYLDAKCNKESGQAGYRILDKASDMSAAPKHWQDAMRPRTSYPWLVISDGKTGYDGPMPGTIEEIQTLLKKWGGE